MSKTRGHKGNRFMGIKEIVKEESRRKRRAREREARDKLRSGQDADSLLWPMNPNDLSDWWSYD